jgi:cobalt-zinc-cadmium efflux system outer membrane protein
LWLERQVITEVRQAEQDYTTSRLLALRFQKDIVPAARAMRDDMQKLFVGGETDIVTYLTANAYYIEKVRQYRDIVVQHRRSMLMLNTAVGQRILP